MKKTCRQCGQDAEHYDSIATHCKECWKAKVVANRAANAFHYREFDRKRSATPERRALSAKRMKRARREKDGMMAAHNAVARAVRKGTLVRPDHCSRCLIPCHPQAHHDDHSKPLDVMWLCPICHAQRHKELGKL